MIALEFQRQLIKEQTNDLIIQQKLDKVKAYGHLKELIIKTRFFYLMKKIIYYVQEYAQKLQAKEILYENSLVDTVFEDINLTTTKLASNLNLNDTKNHQVNPNSNNDDDYDNDDEDLKLAKKLQKEEVYFQHFFWLLFTYFSKDFVF